MQYHQLVLMSRQRGVEQLAGQQTTRIRQDDESHAELAALRFVYGQAVREFERGLPIVPEFSFRKAVLAPKLA